MRLIRKLFTKERRMFTLIDVLDNQLEINLALFGADKQIKLNLALKAFGSPEVSKEFLENTFKPHQRRGIDELIESSLRESLNFQNHINRLSKK